MKPTPPPKNTQPGLGRGRVQIALRRLFSLAVEVTTGEILPIGADNAQEIERGISAVAREPNSGLIVVPIPTTTMHHDLIVKLANSYRIPAVYPSRMYVADGGLVSYGWERGTTPRRPGRGCTRSRRRGFTTLGSMLHEHGTDKHSD